MEEEGEYCWMWRKRKQSLSSTIILAASSTPTPTSLFNSSWEEEAFAEDHGRVNGGCIWPPTSYSCSFCNRQFKSAQALGGHMNVHRRDRALLKQTDHHPHPHHHNNNNIIINPNSSDHHDLDAASKVKLDPPILSSNLGEDHRFYSQKLDLDLKADDDHQHKRRRITTDHSTSSIPPLFFTKSIPVDDMDHHRHTHITRSQSTLEFISPSSINEELDLELRLGHSAPN